MLNQVMCDRFKFKQEECSIFGFEAIIDGHRVVGEVKEKEEALNTCDTCCSLVESWFI